MQDLFENPMGLNGFEFVEFASPTPNFLEPIFEKMGFSLVAKHRSKDVLLYRQGDINFIINNEPKKATPTTLPKSMGRVLVVWRFGLRTLTRHTSVPWSLGRSRLRFPRLSWN